MTEITRQEKAALMDAVRLGAMMFEVDERWPRSTRS